MKIERYTERKVAKADCKNDVLEPGDWETVLDDHGEPYRVRFLCPCGCGDMTVLFLHQKNDPKTNHNWDYRTEGRLISPSVQCTVGCKSHYFILADGTVQWQ